MSDSEKIFQVITANKLREGVIVYLTKDGGVTGWTENIDYAYIADEDELGDLLAVAQEYEKSNNVVGVYTVEIAGSREPFARRDGLPLRSSPRRR